ncbi:MAG: tetratricopeptide repeat protein, partial [Candidatus Obscuribacterales bacterium]|nr:tetratricopeptide repeat protein [Candidatus Obscuribacterales bacterium]
VQSNSGKQKPVQPVETKQGSREWGEYRELAEQAVSQGNYARAEAMWLKAIAEANSFPMRDWRISYGLESLGSLYYSEGRFEEAEIFVSRSFEATVQAYGAEHEKTADSYNFLSSIYFNVGKIDEALVNATRALSLYRRLNGPEHEKSAMVLYNIAVINHAQGEFETANTYYGQSYNIRSQLFGLDHPLTTKVMRSHHELMIDRRNHEAARRIVDRVMGHSAEI